MRVIDASALIEVLGDGEHREAVAQHLVSDRDWLWAPYLVDAEVGHGLRAWVRAGKISARKAKAALDDLGELRLQRISHELLAYRAWELRDNVSFYDGLYVALAEALKAPLLTLDARLARATDLRVEFEVLPA